MNTLDHALNLLAAREPDDATLQAAQRKLEDAIAAKSAKVARKPSRRVGGWLAAATTAGIVALSALWLPLVPSSALAFAEVQQHFRDFRTLRFDVEQRMNGKVLMKSRVNVTRDGKVRTDVGDILSVIVNSSERRVMTLHHPARVATMAPLDVPVTQEDAMAWLKEIREFQGEARPLPRTRVIDFRKAHGWEFATAAGNIVLWATADGLPLEMTLGGSTPVQLSFDFEFDPELPAQMFSTEIPAGYSLGKEED
jgi:outer membrane lipoprotein-sorting protein